MKRIIVTLVAALSICGIQAQTASEKDKEFINEASQISMLEVKLGELAQTNSLDPEVKKLGQTMVTDHTKANSDLKDLASKKGVTLSTVINPDGYKEYDKLVKMQGKDFDKAYTHCMVKGHKKAICKFKKEASKGNDVDVKTWASNTVPTLEQHKSMSEQTCKAIHHKS